MRRQESLFDGGAYTKSVYTFWHPPYHAAMESSSTSAIVEALTRAIATHRLQPGTKLAE